MTGIERRLYCISGRRERDERRRLGSQSPRGAVGQGTSAGASVFLASSRRTSVNPTPLHGIGVGAAIFQQDDPSSGVIELVSTGKAAVGLACRTKLSCYLRARRSCMSTPDAFSRNRSMAGLTPYSRAASSSMRRRRRMANRASRGSRRQAANQFASSSCSLL